jgi:hypothetical protein
VNHASRPRGCLIFGVLWILVFFFTNLVFALGDCSRDPASGQCPNDAPFESPIIWAELLLLVGGGWFFYRREMKDGDF